MHRGVYAYDGHSATAEVDRGGAHTAQRREQLAAKVVPQWVHAAPRAAARAYVARVHALMPHAKLSAAALLFGVTPVDLSVKIPLSLAGFTTAQLNIPKGTVIIVSRLSSEKKPLDTNPALKLNADDVLVLRGMPHALVSVAVMQSGHPALLKPKESVAMKALVQQERESLSHAAQELHDRLIMHVRRQQLVWAKRNRLNAAAVRIQSFVRGKAARARMATSMDAIWRKQLAVRIRARRATAELVRRKYNGPILNRRLLKRLGHQTSPAVALEDLESEVAGTDSFYAVVFARRSKVARSLTSSMNRLLGAAPEAAQIGVPLPVLTLLVRHVCVTATLLVNEITVERLQLPADVAVTHTKINNIRRPVKNTVRGLDGSQKLLKGDELTLSAQAHRLALVVEVKGGKLALVNAHKTAEAEALSKGRDLLLHVAEKLALWLQKVVRVRMAQRARARRAHAALIIQLALAEFMVRRRMASGDLFTASFAKRTLRDIGVRGGGASRSSSSSSAHASRPAGTAAAASWLNVRTQHRTQVQAAGVLGAELKRVRQKKKPSQAKSRGGGASPASRGGAAASAGGKAKGEHHHHGSPPKGKSPGAGKKTG